MLKESLIAIFAIALIIIGNNVTHSYATEKMNSMSNNLEELRSILSEEASTDSPSEEISEKAKSKMEGIFNYWKEIYSKLAYFIEHDELEKIEQGLTEIKGNIEMEEYQEAVVRTDATLFIIGHIEEKLAFELENIF